MNARKFFVVMLVIGLIKICHAAPRPLVNSSFKLPQSTSPAVSIYPCLACSSPAHTGNGCLTQALQGGVGLQIIF